MKVLSRSGAFRGYLGAAATTFGLYNHVERSSNDALPIELTSSSTYDVQEIVISVSVACNTFAPSMNPTHNTNHEPQQGNDSLAATWVGASSLLQWIKGARRSGPLRNPRIFVFKMSEHSAAACCSWSKTTSVTKWQTEKRIWTVSRENEVSAKYPNPNGGMSTLTLAVV